MLNSQHADADEIVNKKIEIKFNDPRVIEVPREGVLQLTVTGIPDLVTYIICQAHTQYHNITLSTIPMIKVGTSVNGSNIGVVLERKQRQSQADCYLTSHHNYTINVLIYFMYLNYNDPLPGGCNLEFNLENDPNIHIQYTTHATTIQFQWGNVGQPPGSSCELPNFQNQLEYEIYVAYLTENDFSESTYFTVVKSVLSTEQITRYGKKLKTIRNNGRTKSQLLIGSYVGQGAIYSVVVKQQDPTGAVTMASYIPMVTYACNLNKSGDCVETDVIWKIYSVIGGVVGLFLCFFGHRYFKTELFIGGFMAVFLVSYILLNLFTSLSTAESVILSTVFGVVGGGLWLMFWWAYGLHVISVLLFALVGGYLVSSIIFFTPFGNLEYWIRSFNYGMTFVSGVLLLPVILLSFTKLLNILTCAFVGGYLSVLLVDTFLNTGLKYIIVNSFRHAVIDGYLNVIVSSPFLTVDIVLACMWGLLFVSGTTFQLYREKGRPDFPPCPRKVRAQQRLRADNVNRTDCVTNEEEPLLREERHTVYNTNRPTQHQNNHTNVQTQRVDNLQQQNELKIPVGDEG